MPLKRVVVVVPLYRDFLTPLEKFNLKNNSKVLRDHHFAFVGPEGGDLYESIESIKLYDYSINKLPDFFFDGIKGYNKLMLSTDFYNRFLQWEYMLICQLDAYIFVDELIKWCQLGYDYIGPAWFTDDNRYTGNKTSLAPWKGCNGGLSLRKVQTFIDTLNKKRYASLTNIFKKGKSVKEKLLSPMKYFGANNQLRSFILNYQYYEDRFWSFDAPIINKKFLIPRPEVLLKFGFERHPELSYKLNERNLPFGCHAWEKYSPEFWRSFIPFNQDLI